jgi:hypothetical protein
MNETSLILEPVVSLHFYRSRKDESVFYVTWKEGKKKMRGFQHFWASYRKNRFLIQQNIYSLIMDCRMMNRIGSG